MNRRFTSRVVCAAVFAALSAANQAMAQARSPFVSSGEVVSLLQPYREGPGQSQLLENVTYRRAEFQSALRWLLAARIPEQVPVSLVRGLRADFAVLRSPGSPAKSKEIAVDDLILKGTFCRNSPEGLGASVTISVQTLLKEAEKKGWEVVYKTAVEAQSDAIPPTAFPLPSSPTSERLTAGRFVVWARDPNRNDLRGSQRELVIRGDQAKMDFVVYVPESK